MLKDLYTDTVNCVRLKGEVSDWFHFSCGVQQGCTVAPSNRHCSFFQWTGSLNAHLTEGFWGQHWAQTRTDLDYADDVALLSEMLEVLLLALDVLKEEASPLALEVNWQKTKIQTTIDSATLPPSVLVTGNSVDIVESFVYLGSEVHSTGSSESEVRCRISLAKTGFNQLNRGIWRSSISISTNVQLYRVCIQPILLYGSETRALTVIHVVCHITDRGCIFE